MFRVIVVTTFSALLVLTNAADGQVITSGPPSCAGVALTFDLCPVRWGKGFDEPLMDYLVKHEVPATFFMSGKWIRTHHSQVKSLLGYPFFEIGTHGEVHAHLQQQTRAQQRGEILGPVQTFTTRFGLHARLFRPPYGEYDQTTIDLVHDLGLQFVLWDVVSGDPDPALPTQNILERLKRSIRKGSIIVMHANEKGKHTREVVEILHREVLPQRGLTPMTVTALLSCNPATP